MKVESPWPKTIASFFLVALACWGEEVPDELTSLSYISYLERYATIKTAAQRETLDAVVNMPILPGDRVETARGARMEVQTPDGSTVWLNEFTTVDFDAIANSRGTSAPRTTLYLAAGDIAVEVGSQASAILVDSPAGKVYLARGGLYRLQLEGDQLRVAAYRGSAELPAGMGSVLLRAGFAAWVAGNEELEREEWRGDGDDFWGWVLERRTAPAHSPSTRYVEGAPRAYVLDSYGEWVYVSDLDSWGWRPRVSITWVPYSYGRWYWTPAGWYWVSYEPWGWYPYHYGSWYFSVSFGWVWFWERVWAPAWVHWIYTPGYVGWCPRGYYDWWWWHTWGDRYHRPHRWSEVSFDFSGRVRLDLIDHRPWTFVPEDRFTHSHIERVRLDPGEIVRTIGRREAYVRSGPLVDREPRASVRAGDLDDLFRNPANREVTSYLRREGRNSDEPRVLPPLTRTSDAVRSARPVLERRPVQDDDGRQILERPIPRDQDLRRGGTTPPGSSIRSRRLPEPSGEPQRGEQPLRQVRPPSSWEPRVPVREVPSVRSPRETLTPRPPQDSPFSSRRILLPESPRERPAPKGVQEPPHSFPRYVPEVRRQPSVRETPSRGSGSTSSVPRSFPQPSGSPRVYVPPRPSSSEGSRDSGHSTPRSRPSTDRPRH